MKSMCKGVFALSLLCGVAACQAIVFDFDDVVTTTNDPLASNYQGFTWTAAGVVNGSWYNTGYGNTVTFPSGSKALINYSGAGTVTVSSNTLFTFGGLSAAYWAHGNTTSFYLSSTSLTVRGYLNNVLVGSSTMNLGTQFASMGGFAGSIDRLELVNDGQYYRQWLVDNLTLATPGTVPEPMTMGLGLAAVVGYARRRMKTTA